METPPIHQKYVTIDTLPDHRTESEKQNTPLSTYNHDNPDIAYAERLAEEIINISGAWITIYARTSGDRRDEVWEEDADPTYQNPIMIKGLFEPKPAEIDLKKWGIDLENETTIHFSRAIVYYHFGDRMIREGDILIVPHNTLATTQLISGDKIDTFRVLKSSDTGVFKYRWLYWSCLAQSVTGCQTIQVPFRGE